MTSTIKVNNIQNQCGQNIINENSNTITIGASGDTISLASGASQSGFGREGSVNWQTTIKTGDFTAASGEGYFINTTSGAITMTLPSSPSAGDIVAFKDYANTFDTNNLTINRNGQPLSGDAADAIISTEGQALTLVYGDATKGWQAVEAATEADLPKPSFVAATGGTITTVCTNFKVHTFTGPGTFQVTDAGSPSGSNQISYLVVAGGGAAQDGGAGAGGFREGKTPQCSYTSSPLVCTSGSNNGLPVAVASYPVTVGGGAAYTPGPGAGTRCGSNSTFAGTTTITSAGGGAGATSHVGGAGGSGGANRCAAGGAGNSPPVSPPQGQPGGPSTGPNGGAGGGGGATTTGGAWPGPRLGGTGATTHITGSPVAYAGGGSGAAPPAPSVARSPCGTGGAGISGGQSSPGTQCGVVNKGGGGGGVWNGTNGSGGSGVVIIRYRFQ